MNGSSLPRLCLLLVLVAVGSLQPASSSLRLYVTPDSSSSPCPPTTICYTLQHYTQNSSSYFVPGATLLFLPGTHSISSPVRVHQSAASEEPLQLLGMEDETIISCEVPLSLSFTNCSSLTLSQLVISGCGTRQQPALLFNSVQSLQLTSLRILNSLSTDVLAVGVANVSITDSSFSAGDENANTTVVGQCSNNKAGTLCNGCREGLSLTLGHPTCRQCSNEHLSLLFVFVLSGPLILAFIMILDLTVARGTINGLLFYANIVWINRYLFFNSQGTSFAFVFLAWLNLDLGVATCFYDGLDMYALTWLQYGFPLYVCLLALLLVALSHWFPRHLWLTKILASNSTSVLATVFLLTYTKILRNIVNSLRATRAEMNQQPKLVWALDGNYEYLGTPHVFLFTAAILLIVILWLPYTLTLLLGHRILPKLSRNRFTDNVRCVLETYHSPLMPHKRFWVGLLLLARSVLLLASALVPSDRETLNLLLTLLLSLLLLYLLTKWGSVYRNRHVGQLEASFVLNVAVLAAVEMYTVSSGVERRIAVIQTSTFVVFIKFLVVLMYHVYSRVCHVGCVKDFETKMRQLLPKWLLVNNPKQVRTISLTESLRIQGIDSNEGGPSLDSQSLPSTMSWAGGGVCEGQGTFSSGTEQVGNSNIASTVRREAEKETELSQVRRQTNENAPRAKNGNLHQLYLDTVSVKSIPFLILFFSFFLTAAPGTTA